MGHKRKVWSGSFTVEASFVLPIVIFVVLSLIYMSFYLHDNCVIRSVSDRFVFELCRVQEKKDVHMDHVTGLIQEELRQKLFWFRVQDVSIKETLQHVTLTVSADAKLSTGFLKRLLPKTRIKIHSSGMIYHPTVTTRYGKIIIKESSKMELFDKLQDFLNGGGIKESR